MLSPRQIFEDNIRPADLLLKVFRLLEHDALNTEEALLRSLRELVKAEEGRKPTGHFQRHLLGTDPRIGRSSAVSNQTQRPVQFAATGRCYGYQYFAKDEKVLPDAPEAGHETSNSEDNLDTLLDACEEAELGEDAKRNITQSVEGEEVEKSVRAAYRMARMKVPRPFTSMAARIHGFPSSNADLTPYGDVVIVVDLKEVRDHLVVFSGDVKTLGRALLGGEGGYAKAWRIRKSIDALEKKLRKYKDRSQIVKHSVGRYFEARLTRALKVTDISKIYVPESEEGAWKAADQINTLKVQKAQNRSRRLSTKGSAATRRRARRVKTSPATKELKLLSRGQQPRNGERTHLPRPAIS